MSRIVFLTLALGFVAALDAGDVLVRATRVYPVSSAPIDNGEVYVRDDRIVAIGARGSLAVSGDAMIVEHEGSLVPGFIDCGSAIGVRGRAAEEFRELTPEMRVEDALDVDAVSLRRACLAGVTTAAVTPGDRNVIGGLGVVLSTRARNLERAVLRSDAFLALSATDAAASGNRSLRSSAPSSYYFRIPTTRMGAIFLARKALLETLDDTPKKASIATPGLAPLLTDRGRAVVLGTLDGARPLRVRADVAQEIVAALRMADEFHATIVIEGFVEGSAFIPEVARRRLSVLIRPGAFTGGVSADGKRFLNLARQLEAAGVRFGFFSDSGTAVAELRERVAVDLRFGLSEETALRALTLDAAAALGVEKITGSIDAGKRADLVALSGDPFATSAGVAWVMAGGEIVQE